jgi:hypothetical protein
MSLIPMCGARTKQKQETDRHVAMLREEVFASSSLSVGKVNKRLLIFNSSMLSYSDTVCIVSSRSSRALFLHFLVPQYPDLLRRRRQRSHSQRQLRHRLPTSRRNLFSPSASLNGTLCPQRTRPAPVSPQESPQRRQRSYGSLSFSYWPPIACFSDSVETAWNKVH